MEIIEQPPDDIVQRARPREHSSAMTAARVLSRIIFVSLLTTIALTAIPYGTVQPWWIAVFECVIFILGMLALIEGFLSKRSWPRELSLALPLLALVVFMLFQSLPLFSS